MSALPAARRALRRWRRGAKPERTGVVTSGLVAETIHGLIAMFKTGPGHTREHLAQILDQRQDPLAPIQMPDALARTTPGAHPTQTASCIPHGTRKFVDLHRKNALFYHTVNSAKVGDLFMSPIHFGTRDPTTPR